MTGILIAFVKKVPGWLWGTLVVLAGLGGAYLRGRKSEARADALRDMQHTARTQGDLAKARQKRIADSIQEALDEEEDVAKIVREGNRRVATRPVSDSGRGREARDALNRARGKFRP